LVGIEPGTSQYQLSRASPASPHLKRGSYEKPPSLPNPALKPSYSQIVKTKKPPRDPKRTSCDPSCDVSRDPPVPPRSHDQARDPGAMAHAPAMKGSQYWEVPSSIPTKDNYLARDPGNLSHVSSHDPLLASAPCDQSHDLIRSRDHTQPCDQARFG